MHDTQFVTGVEDTPARQSPNKFGFALDLYVSVFDSIRQEQIVDSLRCELASIRDSTEHYRRLNERLVSEPAMVEQVARENYGMKKANEDVYNFVESND